MLKPFGFKILSQVICEGEKACQLFFRRRLLPILDLVNLRGISLSAMFVANESPQYNFALTKLAFGEFKLKSSLLSFFVHQLDMLDVIVQRFGGDFDIIHQSINKPFTLPITEMMKFGMYV